MKEIIDFLFEVGMLKKTPRTGYQFLGSGHESVAEHSFRTAAIGYVLASGEPDIDRNRVVLMCLFHDLPEARTGDLNYLNKRYVKADEKSALHDQTRNLPFGKELIALAEEFNAGETPDARLSKDSDQIDLILELKEQLDLGNPNAAEWIRFATKRLFTENAKKMAREILKTHSAEWWFDKETDWWVNGPENQRKKK